VTAPALPAVAVTLDAGSAGLVDLRQAAEGLCRLVFVHDRSSAYASALLDVLPDFGAVCDVTGLDAAETAAAVGAHRPTGIVTFSEFQLGRTAWLAARLGLRFHTPSVADVLTRKSAQRATLAAAGVDARGWRLVGADDDPDAALMAVGLPAVVKPEHGAASRHTYLVGSLDEGRRAVAAVRSVTGPAIVEELLRGDERWAGPGWGDYVSVESLVIDGAVRHAAVIGKLPLAEPFRETGFFVPSTLDDEALAEVRHLSDAALRALGVRWGLAQTEVKLTDDGPRIIEVNGRLGGFVHPLLTAAGGPDLIRVALRTALGEADAIAPLTGDRVAFQYFPPAPSRICRLRSITPASVLRTLDGIDRFVIEARPGDLLDHRDGTGSRLGIVYGRADDHHDLRRVLDRVKEELVATYDDAVPRAHGRQNPEVPMFPG
jgi:biotin carboxylase